MLWHIGRIAPTNTGGEFEHYRACVRIAPAPVRHALSNNLRVGWTKLVTVSKRQNINDFATVGARRRRRREMRSEAVGTQPHLPVVGAYNPIAVPGLAQLGARRGVNRRMRSSDHHLSGSLSKEGF
jgi:hypothetical protein